MGGRRAVTKFITNLRSPISCHFLCKNPNGAHVDVQPAAYISKNMQLSLSLIKHRTMKTCGDESVL
jgi:hypothetical protein